MTDIATAYVQIVPSARGLKDSLGEELGGEGEKAGKESGKKFGAGFKVAAAAAVTAAAAAVGKIVKASLSEGAALEQSLGGVETLFKANASTVIANAQQAYQTAGMSANTYMEQVTSFSASLLQSLGGDTAAAASVADMAIRDMSDNANKFGTDIDSITNAYQGFAKQNYTMLDNLKLGYGGTKSEMERLLADAQELTGVKYDINNLSDVYNAIHAVQEELGVTGTTAKEASSTLTGSLNSMKAAFSNVLGNLALGQEIGPSLEALAETVSTFLVGNLVPMVTNIITALPGALMAFINALLPANMGSIVSTAVSNFSNFVTSSLPTFLNNGVQMIDQLVSGITSSIPAFSETWWTIIETIGVVIYEGLPQLLSGGTQLIANLSSGISSAVPKAVEAMTQVIKNMLSTCVSNLPDLLAMGIEFILQLCAGLISSIGDVIVAIIKVIKALCDAWGEIDWADLGNKVIDGIYNGICNGVDRIIQAAKDAANRAFEAAKEALGIHSPSRLFRKGVGEMISKGMALGITDGIPMVQRAMNALTDTTAADLASTVSIGTSRRNGYGQQDGSVYGGGVSVVQNIYSRAQTAADLMQEARYQAEMAVLLGV